MVLLLRLGLEVNALIFFYHKKSDINGEFKLLCTHKKNIKPIKTCSQNRIDRYLPRMVAATYPLMKFLNSLLGIIFK